MRIDSHQHFWKFDPKRQDWITKSMKPIRQDFLPEDLKSHLDSFLLDACVAVQAEESNSETEFLLDLAEQNEWISAVVGWMDLADPDLDQKLEKYQPKNKLKGFREVLQSKEPHYFLRKEFIQGLKTLYKKGYSYDLLLYYHQLPAIFELIKKVGEQRLVIDHLAKPPIQSGRWKEWRRSLKPLAERDYIYCKLSGMVTEANWEDWSYEDLLPYMEISLELFGPERLLFGSDWPVCLLAGEYEQVYGVIENFTDSLSTDEKALIFGKSAQEFYQIKSPKS